VLVRGHPAWRYNISGNYNLAPLSRCPALPPIHYWHSEDVSPDVAELMGTFAAHAPKLRYRSFSEPQAKQFIARHYGARQLAAFRACAVPAMQADYFRDCAMHALAREPQGNLTNAFFVFRTAKHPFLRLALDIATSNIERRAPVKVNQATGPWVFSSLAVMHELGSAARAPRAADQSELGRYANSLLAAVGDYERVTQAFEYVTIVPLHRAWRWIDTDLEPPSYRQNDSHWARWPGELPVSGSRGRGSACAS
jgi:hypothetical protein